jgi:hypothetical protein
VYRLKRVVVMVFGATLLASLVLGGSAFAKEGKSVELHLTPSRHSGVSGTATLKEVEGGGASRKRRRAYQPYPRRRDLR